MKSRILLCLVSVLMVAACAALGPRERDAEAYERYMDFAGAPIDDFTYLGRIDSWRPLGNNALAVRTSVDDAYVISVAGPCRDLQFENHIALTSSGHTVRRGFDSVRVGRENCMITEIRPVDYGEMQKAARLDKESSPQR